ncbi:MAG: hypothetical protein NUV51_10985 [Sulfuricaulis sp.]|nr:hypothetical protein [Sulfuricaulis sp.]
MTDSVMPFIDNPVEANRTRQDARMAEIPELYRKTHERLAVELALKVDDAESIFASYKYTPEEAAELMESPAFLALLGQAAKEVQESGLSFRTKAKLLAGELLPYANDIATDPLQSAAVRADLIKWSAKVAGFEPKEKDDAKVGGGFTLSITFAGQEPQKVISSHEPLTIEQEA